MIFEGIDWFVDTSTKDFVPVDVWLPKSFPTKVRVIVSYTTDRFGKGPRFHEFFKSKMLQMLKIQHNKDIVKKITEKYMSNDLCLDKEHNKNVKDYILNHVENFVTNLLFLNLVLEGLSPQVDSSLSSIDIDKLKDIYKEFIFEDLQRNISSKIPFT